MSCDGIRGRRYSTQYKVSGAKDPVKMAEAMKLGIHVGRLSYEAGRIPVKYTAQASSPTEGLGFL